jgi:hypothetical protein
MQTPAEPVDAAKRNSSQREYIHLGYSRRKRRKTSFFI